MDISFSDEPFEAKGTLSTHLHMERNKGELERSGFCSRNREHIVKLFFWKALMGNPSSKYKIKIVMKPAFLRKLGLKPGAGAQSSHWDKYETTGDMTKMTLHMGRQKPNKTQRRRKGKCLPPTQPYPWLLFFNSSNDEQTFCSISDPNKTYWRSIPEFMDEFLLLTVQHSWCLFCKKIKGAHKLFIWQPTNLEKIILPDLNLKHERISDGCCILSCPPTATDQVCTIFLFSCNSKILFYYQLGDKEWTSLDYSQVLARLSPVAGSLEIYNYLVNPVYCNGRLYAESSIGHLLVVIEKHEGGFEINSTHVFLPHTHFDHSSQLLQFNNELFHIQITFEGSMIISVAVHTLDFSQMVWEKVKSMKDKVFFLSDYSSFACQTINPEIEGGRIYYTFDDNAFVHIYNIEENSLIRHSFSNLPTKLFRSLWFMPDLRTTFSLRGEREKTQIKSGKISVAAHPNKTGDKATNSCAFSFEALPFDIMEEVAKCLDVLDYLHFRATNNFFRLSAPPLQSKSLSHTLMSSFDDLSLSSLFVFFEKENVLTFVHPKYGIKYKYNINLPKDIKGDCQILCSKDGWLLLAVDKFFNIFFNPFTREVKQLAYGPSPENQTRDTMSVGILHSPTSSECVVVELHRSSHIAFYMKVHTTRLWQQYWESDFKMSKFSLSCISPCFHNGIFYYLSCEGKLATLKENEEEDIIWEELEKPDAPCTDDYKSFLVECNGSLLSVFECAFGNWVRVFKLNESEMIWTRVESLDNHMLFVGKQSFSAVANIPGMENKIYFPKIYDENIIFYSLETKRYQTFKSTEVVDSHMSEQFNSSWIQPSGH